MADKKTTFSEAMRAEKNAQSLIAGGKWTPEMHEAAFGRNILHEDLEYIGDGFHTVYSLNDDVRDRLIAHSRQDIAMAYAAISNLKTEMRRLRTMLSIAILLIIALLSVQVFT